MGAEIIDFEKLGFLADLSTTLYLSVDQQKIKTFFDVPQAHNFETGTAQRLTEFRNMHSSTRNNITSQSHRGK